MAKDIRKLFNEEHLDEVSQMPSGHRDRFLKKLGQELPKQSKGNHKSWWFIAASVIVLLGFGVVGFLWTNQGAVTEQPKVADYESVEESSGKTLGDVSPDLKKVEDYYLASINFELSKVKVTPENKELFDGYVKRLEELNIEYRNLTKELTDNGPNEFTVNALINNLKLRLNLLYRLREQLEILNNNQYNQKTS